jgi:hypothetical protein
VTSKHIAPTSAPDNFRRARRGDSEFYAGSRVQRTRRLTACADSHVLWQGTVSGGAQVTMTYHGGHPSERSKVTQVVSLLGAAMAAAKLDDRSAGAIQ